MNLYSETHKTARIIFASLAMFAAAAQLRPVYSGETAAAARSLKTKAPGPTTSSAANQQAAPAFRARIDNDNPAHGTWNRAPSRSAGFWTSAQSDSTSTPKIRFASASGMDDGEASAVETSTSSESNATTKPADSTLVNAGDAATAGTIATSEETPPPASSSVSVKEQLLNAMRMQREALTNSNALKPTTPSGSLTIMNSPRVTPKSPLESGNPVAPPSSAASPQSPASTNQPNAMADVNESAVQPKSPKSNTGLTRTLEEDLKSNDPYLRERAQRFLRLQIQLQQLRSRQTAAADAAAVDTAAGESPATNNANGTSIPGDPDESGLATHAISPSHELPSGNIDGTNLLSGAEQKLSHEETPTPNSHDPHPPISDQHTVAEEKNVHEATSDNSTHEPAEPSANATLLEHVVVNGPIDRLGLANNLFAIGEYPLALEMYQQTTGPELSSQQQFWVEYQTASCLRHLGSPAEASNRFRKLASQPEAGWLSQQAQRWVEHLESIRVLEKALKDNSVEQWQKVIDSVESQVAEPPVESTTTSDVSESSKNLEPAKNEHTH